MENNGNIRIDIVSYENNNCTKREIEELIEVFKRKFISWISWPSTQDRYELAEIIFELKQPPGFTLLIQQVYMDNAIPNTRNHDFYDGTFENEKNGKTLVVNAILSYL